MQSEWPRAPVMLTATPESPESDDFEIRHVSYQEPVGPEMSEIDEAADSAASTSEPKLSEDPPAFRYLPEEDWESKNPANTQPMIAFVRADEPVALHAQPQASTVESNDTEGRQVIYHPAEEPETSHTIVFHNPSVFANDQEFAQVIPAIDQLPRQNSTHDQSVGIEPAVNFVQTTDSGLEPVTANIYPIDLANVIGLGGGNHLQVKMAREKVIQAQADLTQARALWLPDLRFGVGWNHHDGRLQQSSGDILEVSRNSLFVGGGAGYGQAPLAGGAGGPTRLMVNLSLADAIFQQRIMQNRHFAAAEGSKAVFNDALMQVASGYMDLVETHGLHANAQTGVKALSEMVATTSAFEEAGEGTRLEVSRAETQLALQRRSLANLDRQTKSLSIELIRLLRLDPSLTLVPADVQVAPLEIVDATLPIPELIGLGLASRPETCQQKALVWAARQQVRQERWRPWLPNVQVGASGGNFGGGRGSNYTNSSGRSDVDLLAVWEVKNLGYGNQAMRQRSSSQQREATLRGEWVRDQVEAEIVAAANDVNGYREQMYHAQRAAEVARETYDKNMLKITGGEGLPLELLQAIDSMVQSLDAYVSTVANYNRAQFRLLRAIGQTPN